jgi:two-component system chemotaxis response regulator CheY
MRSLIVEDDFSARKLLQVYLADYGDTSIAVNGKEAVSAVEDSLNCGKPYDLICLDVVMPEMDGLGALKHIRKLEQDRGMTGLDGAKVIMITCRDQPRDIFTAFKTGCEAYIVKPVRKGKLVEEMTKLGLTE